MSFSGDEKAYLDSQRLGRFATVSREGQPDVAPVGFDFDGERFSIGGLDLAATRKYRNVIGGNDKVALVVDDLVSIAPWSPRFMRIYGTASVVRRDDASGSGESLQVIPTVSWSWNLDGRPINEAGAIPPRRVVHRSSQAPGPRPGSDRPILGAASANARAAVDAFVAGLQSGHDQRDADILNHQFAADVIWGSPYGALVEGYDQLHPIHAHFQQHAKEKPAFRYEVRHVLALADDVVIAHIARLALDDNDDALPPSADPAQPFSEMAMFVLVRRDGGWWLAAGQNTPMRPGGAVAAST